MERSLAMRPTLRLSVPTKSWLQTSVALTPKGARAKPTAVVLHPILEQASNCTTDNFWRDTLKNAACGILPKNFAVKDGIIYYFKKNKTISENIPSEPSTAFITVQTFLRTNGGLASTRDFESRTDPTSITDKLSASENELWTQIPKRDRPSYLNEYKRRLTKQYNLNNNERLQLNILINFLSVIECFNNDTVTLDRRGITSLADLHFDPVTRTFSSSFTKTKKGSKKHTVKKTKIHLNVFEEEWVKYLKEFKCMKVNKTLTLNFKEE